MSQNEIARLKRGMLIMKLTLPFTERIAQFRARYFAIRADQYRRSVPVLHCSPD